MESRVTTGGQEGLRGPWLRGGVASNPQPGLLNGVLRLCNASEKPVGDREQQRPELLEHIDAAHDSASSKPCRHDGLTQLPTESALAFAFEKPRPSVIIPTTISPASNRANHTGTRRGGRAPTHAAK